MELVDTHCHIHFADYGLDPDEVIESAQNAGVNKLICVGCTLPDSMLANQFAEKYDNVWASVGLHPHEASMYVRDDKSLQQFRSLVINKTQKLVAIGETGLDYHYMHSPKDDQAELLRFQLSIAQEFNLPLIFHVRNAFNDFWKIFDEYSDVRGVIHSFGGNANELEQAIKRGLYVGLNGIVTFNNNLEQIEVIKAIPLQKLLLETDAPFLTPVPFRGRIGEPKYVSVTVEFLTKLRSETLQKLAAVTTINAKELFGLY